MTENELSAALLSVGKVNLGSFPTPLHEMPNVAAELQVPQVFVKRDDLTGLGPGGNKVRNLEYILFNAISKGADTVIVSGPAQSNLCTITACACAKLGLDCVLVLNGKENPEFAGNLLLNRLVGANIIYLGPVSKDERNAYMQNVKADLKTKGKSPYVIENGASTGYGALGYMEALLEIKKQSDDLDGAVKTIFVPAGNGGVASGLVFANDLIGRPFQIAVVSTEFETNTLINRMRSVIAEAEDILHIPFRSSIQDACYVTDAYYGGGWGKDTAESKAAIYALPKLEGLYIENVYTSKTYVGLCDCVRMNIVEPNGTCFLHTGGFGSLFAQY